ncbi:tRNA pseudouridine synthase 3 [Perkinsus chesapeaki]|uniref:tRNA pseudouridine synthase 3 n=1 Tax=Perkinsus chesapeaki TaxID=330153 RepID=A0A7J6L783_PERCH|nr:tRNA pseudouridine synthase 3 [Perkinsus chesapeaki]
MRPALRTQTHCADCFKVCVIGVVRHSVDSTAWRSNTTSGEMPFELGINHSLAIAMLQRYRLTKEWPRPPACTPTVLRYPNRSLSVFWHVDQLLFVLMIAWRCLLKARQGRGLSPLAGSFLDNTLNDILRTDTPPHTLLLLDGVSYTGNVGNILANAGKLGCSAVLVDDSRGAQRYSRDFALSALCPSNLVRRGGIPLLLNVDCASTMRYLREEYDYCVVVMENKEVAMEHHRIFLNAIHEERWLTFGNCEAAVQDVLSSSRLLLVGGGELEGVGPSIPPAASVILSIPTVFDHHHSYNVCSAMTLAMFERYRLSLLKAERVQAGLKDLSGISCMPTSQSSSSTEPKSKRRRKAPRGIDWSTAKTGRYLIKFAYVGTKYAGVAWQNQEEFGVNTVENELFKGLVKTCLIESRASCDFSRCGRTDKGVHARGNYATLRLRLKPDGKEFPYIQMMNRVLPDDIRVLRIYPVPNDDFDARFSCRSRTYKYFFSSVGLNLDVMAHAAKRLVGAHDYRNFCRMDVEQTINFERTIYSFEFAAGDVISHAIINGSAFLWHQVRCMMEILMLIGRGLEQPDVIDTLLDVEKTPGKPNYDLADGAGLVLFDCKYDEEWLDQDGQEDRDALALFSRAVVAAQRDLAVLQCLAGDTTESGEGPRKYVPIMQRAKGPTLEERVAVAELRNARKDVSTTESVPSSATE